MKKLILLLSTFIFTVFGSNFANAIFDNAGNYYYFQNTQTKEIKKIGINQDNFKGLFYQFLSKNITKDTIKDIPIKGYFKNWDLVGYYSYYSNLSTISYNNCVLYINLTHKKDTSKCKELQNNSNLKINDLFFSDKIQIIFKYTVQNFSYYLLGILFNFFVFFPLVYLIYKTIYKKINSIKLIYLSILLYIFYEIVSSMFGFSKIVLIGEVFGGLNYMPIMFIKILLFFIGFPLFFNKCTNTPKNNTKINIFLLILFVGIIFTEFIFLGIDSYQTNLIIFLLFCFLTILYLIKRKKIEQYLETKLMKCTH